MYIKFQFRSSTFAEMIRDGLQRSDVGCVPPGADGFAVERLEFLPTLAAPLATAEGTASDFVVHTVPVAGAAPIAAFQRKVLLTVPIRVVAHTLKAWIEGTPEPALTFAVNARLEIDLVAHQGKDKIRIGYHSLARHPDTPDAIEDIVHAKLAAGAIEEFKEFDFTDKVFGLLGGLGSSGPPPKVCWRGLALSADRSTLEFRLELTTGDASGTHLASDWQYFYSHQFDDRREGRDWAVAIPQELIVAAGLGTVNDSIADEDISLSSGPDMSWRPDPPGLTVSFSGEKVDACQCFFGMQDVDVDVTANVEIWLEHSPDGPKLVVDQRQDVDADNLEVLCCGVFAVLDFSVSLVGSFFELVLDVLTLPLRTLTGSFGTKPGPGAPAPVDPCTTDPDDDDHTTCRYPLALNPAPNRCDPAATTLEPDRVRGFVEALVLQGGAEQRQVTSPVPRASVPTAFEWKGPTPTCNGVQGQWDARCTFTVVQTGGELPLDICGVQPVGATGPFYRSVITAETACPARVTAEVEVRALPGVHAGIAIPGAVLVLTNGGNVLVEIPPVPARDEAAVQRGNIENAVWRTEHCYIFLDEWPGRFDPHWLVDPSPLVRVSEQLWVVRAGLLDRGDQIVMLSGDEVLATGLGDTDGNVRLELRFDGDIIGIERRSADGSLRAGQRYGLNIKQVALTEVGAARVAEPMLAVARAGTARRPRLSALTGSRLATFELGPDGTVAEVDTLAVPPVVRAMAQPSGFEAVTAEGRTIRLTAGTDRTFEVAPADGDTGLARLDRLTGPLDGLGQAGRLLGGGQGGRVTAARAVAGNRRAVLELDDGGYLVADAAAGEARAHYRERPWSDGLVRIGGTYARLDDDRLGFRFLRIAGTFTL